MSEPHTHLIDAPALAMAQVALQIVDGPDRSVRHTLAPGTTRVGTGPGCQVKLNDPTVSRLHCEIRLSREGIRIVDSGSRNGTIIEGVRVHDAELTAGAAIRLGATVLRIEVGPDTIPVPVSESQRFGEVLGASLEMRRLYALLERAAPTEATVLIQGETGTGKELIARAVHDHSKRKDRPFIAVDCGAIAESLMESELFGHMRGAFSGAVADRKGLLEEANGGTVFLDEIGEIPAALQSKLLRALEAREVRRVGSNTHHKIDVRFVAATNRSLARSVNDGTFREDLYYRLAVVEITVPPLRARRDDILKLAEHFFVRFAGKETPFPAEMIPTLMARAWPGNVRELRNFIERSVSVGWTAGRTTEAPANATPPGLEALVPAHLGLKEAREAWTRQFETLYVNALLRRTGGNVTRAAELAGVNRRSLQRLMADLGIRSADVED